MIINKFIIHVLDKNSDVPILNDFEGRISQEVDRFLQKMIKRVVKDDNLRKGVFKDYYNNTIHNLCTSIIYDQSKFVENSKEIGAYLFDVMKVNSELSSCDLAICYFTIKDESYIAILKLDYKNIYNHLIEFVDDKFNVQIVSNEIGISETQKIKQGAIIGVSGINDEYHLLVLDKEAEREGIRSQFLIDFLDIERINDDKYKTELFYNLANNFITNAFSDDIRQAENARSILHYIFKENRVMDIEKFTGLAMKDSEFRENFMDCISEKGIDRDFNIDKKWVENKLRNRHIKTDNGFSIKGNLSDFEDTMKYSIIQNSNGSIDITIKNIKFYEEK